MATMTYLQLSAGVWIESTLDLTGGTPSATYEVVTAATGYSVGDTLVAIPVITQGSPFTFVMKWVNLNTGLELASPPNMAHILLSTQALGQTTAAKSQSVVIASDQSAVPVSGTFWQATQPVSAASLPLPAGAATAAKQPALGTAGTASADVLSVQGIASGTPLSVSFTRLSSGTDSVTIVPSGTQTVTGTVTANTGLSQPLTDTQLRAADVPVSGTFWQATQPVSFTRLASGTDSIAAVQSGTWNVTNVSGTVSLPTGASTSAKQDTGNTSLSSIDTKIPALVQGVSPTLIYGLSDGGNQITPIAVSNGHLEVALQNPDSVFGEQLVSSMHALVQGDFAYGLNSNIVTSSVTGSGTATSATQMGVCSTTAAASSSATIRSTRTGKYRPGQGVTSRFTAIFTTGVANSTQTAGMFNAQDAFAVGYNGTAFGILWRRNSVDTWTDRGSFNIDVLDGTDKSGMTLDPTKLNIFKIQYGFLGVFGALFSVVNPLNGQWVDFHRISFANSATQPQFINPTLWFQLQARNTTNNTNIVVKTASFGVFLEGERRRLGGIYGSQNFKSIAAAAGDTNVLTVRCNTTINGATNNSIIRIRSLSVATAAGVPVIFKAIRNATLGGTPAYTNIDATNSLAAVDTAGTTATGGTVVFNTSTATNGDSFCDLTDFDIQLQPGETLTLTAVPISGGAANHVAAINWSEDT